VHSGFRPANASTKNHGAAAGAPPLPSGAVPIRTATAADHPRLLRLWRAAVEATHDFLTPADVDALDPQVAAYLADVPELLVAESGSGIQGFIGADGRSIEMLFVDPAVHGRGVGTALIAALGPGPLTVDVNEDNPSGRRFYAARGFVEVGRSPLDGEGRPFPLLHLRRD